jgi:hypothetical protein
MLERKRRSDPSGQTVPAVAHEVFLPQKTNLWYSQPRELVPQAVEHSQEGLHEPPQLPQLRALNIHGEEIPLEVICMLPAS